MDVRNVADPSAYRRISIEVKNLGGSGIGKQQVIADQARPLKTEMEAWFFYNSYNKGTLDETVEDADSEPDDEDGYGVEAGELKILMPQYEVDLTTGHGRSRHARFSHRYLIRMAQAMNCKTTIDFTPKKLQVYQNSMVRRKDESGKWVGRKDCGCEMITTLKRFLRHCCNLGYRINRRVLEYRPKGKLKIDSTVRDAWTDTEVKYILEYLIDRTKRNEQPWVREPCNCVRSKQGCEHSKRVLKERTDCRRAKSFLVPFRYMVKYGTRPGETSDLTVSCWNSSTGEMTIKDTKNKMSRRFTVDSITKELIDQSVKGRDSAESIFLMTWGTKWTSDSMTHFFKDVLLKDLKSRGTPVRGTLYWTRHTASTNLLIENNFDRHLVKTITGHKKSEQLDGYVHIAEQRIRMVAHRTDIFDQAKGISELFIESGLVDRRVANQDLPRMRTDVEKYSFLILAKKTIDSICNLVAENAISSDAARKMLAEMVAKGVIPNEEVPEALRRLSGG